MSNTAPEPLTTAVPARRETPEQRAARNPLVRLVVAAKTNMDLLRATRLVKRADRLSRRDGYANNDERRQALLQTYQSGVSPESLSAGARAGKDAVVAAIETAQRAAGDPALQQGGHDAARADTEAALRMTQGVAVPGGATARGDGQGAAPASDQSAVRRIDPGKGNQGPSR
jgi:hypothetical protein